MGSNHYYEATDMQAAIAKRLAHVALNYAGAAENALQSGAKGCAERAAGMHVLPAIGAALIRAGRKGAKPKTLAIATGTTVGAVRMVLEAMEAGGFAMQWTGDVWRLDTVQILAHENRAALEALESATAHERDAAAGAVAQRKENAPAAQTGGKNG